MQPYSDCISIIPGQILYNCHNFCKFVSEKLSTLEYVLSTATHFVLKKYKDHGTIFDEKKADIREVITP